ncbi:MAG: c-type cytochrome [Saccharospirillaceae bacterium]|nr:c-type cytochrome [Pseudomonadales bacterium]NRB80804.1 c-type cytochrome [Saccharospirillaceae bacterium]
MKQIISLLALSLTLVFLSCSTDYEGHVGGASDPDYCNAPDSILDTDQGIESPYPLSTFEKATYTAGCEIYVVKCANCHMLDGATLNAGLDLNDAADDATPDKNCATCEAHTWLQNTIQTTMPPERADSTYLSVDDSAKVATYIRANFYNDMTPPNDTEPENLPESMRPTEGIVNVLGEQLYIVNCSGCHGDEGQGTFIFDNQMTNYTVDKQTLLGKITGSNLGLSGYGSPDDPMEFGKNSADYSADAIAEYMNESFDYINW